MKKLKARIAPLLMGIAILAVGLLAFSKNVNASELIYSEETVNLQDYNDFRYTNVDIAEKIDEIKDFISITLKYSKNNGGYVWELVPKKDCVVKIDSDSAVLAGYDINTDSESDSTEDDTIEYYTDMVANYRKGLVNKDTKVCLHKGRRYVLKNAKNVYGDFVKATSVTVYVDGITRENFSSVPALTNEDITVRWVEPEYEDEADAFKYLYGYNMRGYYEVTVNTEIGFNGVDYVDLSVISKDDDTTVFQALRSCNYTKNSQAVFEVYPNGNGECKFKAVAGRYDEEETKEVTLSGTEENPFYFYNVDMPYIQSILNVGDGDSISTKITFKNTDADEYKLVLYKIEDDEEMDTHTVTKTLEKTITKGDTALNGENRVYTWQNMAGVSEGRYYVGVIGTYDDEARTDTPFIIKSIDYDEIVEGNIDRIYLAGLTEYGITLDDRTQSECIIEAKMVPDDANYQYWKHVYYNVDDDDETFMGRYTTNNEDCIFNVKASEGCMVYISGHYGSDEEDYDFDDPRPTVKSIKITYSVAGETKTDTLTREKVYFSECGAFGEHDSEDNEYIYCYKFRMPASDVVISAEIVPSYYIMGNDYSEEWYCDSRAYEGKKVVINRSEDSLYEFTSVYYVLYSDCHWDDDTNLESYDRKTDILPDSDGVYSFIMPGEGLIIVAEEKLVKGKIYLEYSNPNITLGTDDEDIFLSIRRDKNDFVDKTDIEVRKHPKVAYIRAGQSGILNVSTSDAGYKVTGELVCSTAPDSKTKIISKNGKISLSIPADFDCEADNYTLTLNQEKANGITITQNADMTSLLTDDVLGLKDEKITITAVPKDGKKLDKIEVATSSGAAVEVKAGPLENQYEFIMPDSAVVISAVVSDSETKEEVKEEEAKEDDSKDDEIIDVKPVNPSINKEKEESVIGTDIIKEDTSYEGVAGFTRIDLSSATIVVKDQNYTGDYLNPAVAVSLVVDGKSAKLVEGTDYIKSFDNNKNAGVAKVIITGSGLYKGTVEKTFNIMPKLMKNAKCVTETVMTTDSIDSLKDRILVYAGTEKLEAGKDYKIASLDKEVLAKGKVKATIEGINNYSGTAIANIIVIEPVEKQFMIRKAALKDAKKSELIYTGKNHKFLNTDVEVYSETGELIPESAYSVSVKNAKNVGEGYLTVKAKGREYKGLVVIPFEIKPEQITFNVSGVKDVTYNGKLVRAKLQVKAVVDGKELKLKPDKDYKVTYKDNLNVGAAQITVTGIGNFAAASKYTASFNINPVEIKKVKVRGTKTNGIILEFNKHKLVEGVDYDLSSWTDDEKGVKSTVTITGKRNFVNSTVTKTFKIK